MKALRDRMSGHSNDDASFQKDFGMEDEGSGMRSDKKLNSNRNI